ncbi:hypothetical protein GYMLUDRAFT_203749 [Collybiopsis luxurians FD-317 M1]|uniref:PARP catalytic domain-containing protein n=1 Tax=Collybiopsis luxurians FD-317 M1 TaxID=944289 RepID=A0A0D0B2E1_9AGAR|nr:hypothetical protein GYMLUDRAFT_203749 [Collybiopsis luxurians FD-317 M1]
MIVDEFSFKHPDNQHRKRLSRILPLDSSDPKYVEVEKLFFKGWCHLDKQKPEIRGVFKILSPDESLEPYVYYRSQVQAFNLLSRYKKGANEQLCFHGTRRLCALGEDSSKVYLCDFPGCSICGIIRNSFDVGKCGDAHSFKRFGNGIYTTSCASKADDYSSIGRSNCQHLNRNSRILLLNRVVVGKPHHRRQNGTHMSQPPPGFHSVIGLPGVDLNYEETVVYRNDAIRPAYLVVYGPPVEPEGTFKRNIFIPNPLGNPVDSQQPMARGLFKAHAMLSALFNTPLAV